MAETSSSSSSENYSSSSSLDSSSSSSSSSELISSSSSSDSSSSSSNSSSSSIDSSSSSSSSLWDLQGERLLPFVMKNTQNRAITDIVFNSSYYYACSLGDSQIIRSSDKINWSKYYETDDVGFNKMFVHGGFIFAGTNSKGKIYKINIDEYSGEVLQTLNSTINGFFLFLGKFYCYTDKKLYVWDEEMDIFDLFYDFAYKCNCHYVDEKGVYFGLRSGNVYLFDGNDFSLIFINQNVNSFNNARINSKVFSNLLNSYRNVDSKNKSKDIETINYYENNEQKLMDINPINRDIGISSITKYQDKLVLGSEKWGRLYLVEKDVIKNIFSTDQSPVFYLTKLTGDYVLSSIGNILYFGKYQSVETIDLPTTSFNYSSSVDTSVVTIKKPAKGDQLVNGQEVEITWVSEKGLTDTVKIDLFKGDEFYYSINSSTTNNGLYKWTIPSNIDEYEGYRIKIEWLSSSPKDENTGSSAEFRIATQATYKKETDLKKIAEKEKAKNSAPFWSFLPILHLNDENVTFIKEIDGEILIGTSQNRILSTTINSLNAYSTGNRTITAFTQNEVGYLSQVNTSNIYYALHNKISKINDKKVESYTFAKKATVLVNEEVTGVFISEVFFAQSDFGFWKSLIWNQTKETSTNIKFYIRTGSDLTDLYSKQWLYSYQDSSVGTITKDLLADNLQGPYSQIKVEMKISENDTNKISNISLVYTSQQSEYFFTTMFALERSTSLSRAIVTANITKPLNTEITFGITNLETTDWTKFEKIETDKFFNIDNYDKFKVGIKLSSYSSNLPVVSEFSLITSGSKLKKLNE